MNYDEANQLTASQHPVRRPSWPEGHHVRHHVEESVSKLKMHTPDQADAMEWQPGAEDQAAQDWEQYIPQQKSAEQAPEAEEEEHRSKAKHKK
jgi:hypothetical protein